MPVTPTPGVTPAPDAPQRLTDTPAEFVAKADPFVAWMALFADEMDAVGIAAEANATYAEDRAAAAEASAAEAEAASLAALANSDYAVRSTSSVAIGTGSKSFHFDLAPGQAHDFTVGMFLVAIDVDIPDNRLYGNVTAVDVDDVTINVAAGGTAGSGTPDSWIIVWAGFMAAGAVAADLWAQASNLLPIPPKAVKDAKAFQTLTDGATVTISGASGRNFNWTIGGNRTLAAPTNCAPGDTFLVKVTQDGTGSRVLAWTSGVFRRQGGLPVLSTAAGAIDYLQLKVIAVDGSNVATTALATFVKAPTGS